jgi:hypothetical protein
MYASSTRRAIHVVKRLFEPVLFAGVVNGFWGLPECSDRDWRAALAGAGHGAARIREQRLILQTITVKRISRPAFASPLQRMRRRP